MGIIHLKNINFQYQSNSDFSLTIRDFSVQKNSSLFIDGPSGCGKTTFLNILTGLTQPINGNIHILGTDITLLSKVKSDQFRADHFGIIFQLFNLIPYLSVIENIILPCTFSNTRKQKALTNSLSLRDEAIRLCKELAIENHLITMPVNQLSIGQQQRVSIARALIGQPEIIVADEPTSALDKLRKELFMNLLLNQCNQYNITLIFVSHDNTLKSNFKYSYSLNTEQKTIEESSPCL